MSAARKTEQKARKAFEQIEVDLWLMKKIEFALLEILTDFGPGSSKAKIRAVKKARSLTNLGIRAKKLEHREWKKLWRESLREISLEKKGRQAQWKV